MSTQKINRFSGNAARRRCGFTVTDTVNFHARRNAARDARHAENWALYHRIKAETKPVDTDEILADINPEDFGKSAPFRMANRRKTDAKTGGASGVHFYFHPETLQKADATHWISRNEQIIAASREREITENSKN